MCSVPVAAGGGGGGGGGGGDGSSVVIQDETFLFAGVVGLSSSCPEPYNPATDSCVKFARVHAATTSP